ncbi:MAG: hypothetical protein GX924_03070 [Clostridiaceae bacterium]|jgi:hypothetical protein|nr:hypothetical protein [Clostridiaceae bacterium]
MNCVTVSKGPTNEVVKRCHSSGVVGDVVIGIKDVDKGEVCSGETLVVSVPEGGFVEAHAVNI